MKKYDYEVDANDLPNWKYPCSICKRDIYTKNFGDHKYEDHSEEQLNDFFGG